MTNPTAAITGPYLDLGENLKEARGEQSHTLVAILADVSTATYTSWENGLELPSGEQLRHLFGRLGKNVNCAIVIRQRFVIELKKEERTQQNSEASKSVTPAKSVHFKSDRQDWPTPKALFDELQERYQMERDVCASAANTKLPLFWNKEQNALLKVWDGRLWMNPPYGREIGKWLKKASEAAEYGALVVCLIPARTDTQWWHDYCLKSAEIAFIRGRITFEGAENTAPFPSAIVVFRQGMTVPFVRSWTPGGDK